MIARLFRPVDIASLAALRIVFGALMLAAMTRYFLYGWIDAMYVAPQFFFTYEGFEWVKPWAGSGMYFHYAALVALAFCIAVGFAYRIAMPLFFLGFTYAHLIDKANYLNHYYLLSLIALLLSCMPLGRFWSLRTYSDPGKRLDVVPQWMIWIVRFQIAIVYVFAAIAKLNADWLLNAQPLRLWLAAQGEVPILGPLLTASWAPYAFSWAGAAFDLTIVPFLLWRRTRLPAYACVVCFHVITALLFPIGLFPWVMIGLTTVFFEPDWPRRLLELLGRERRRLSAPAITDRSSRLPWKPNYAVVALLGIYAAIQIAVPLRFVTRTGPVSWTEDGFRFAWRVMLMEKYGRATFEIRDPRSGKSESVDPRDSLSPLQAHMMSTQPDMVLQFAHWLNDRERRRGREVQVRARIDVALNGRPHRALVDPDLDLAAIPLGTAAGDWILPLRDTPAQLMAARAAR